MLEPLQKYHSQGTRGASTKPRQAARPVSPARCTHSSTVEHGCLLLLLQNLGCAERGHEVHSPSALICLSVTIPKLAFHTLARVCLIYYNRDLPGKRRRSHPHTLRPGRGCIFLWFPLPSTHKKNFKNKIKKSRTILHDKIKVLDV